MSIEGCLLQKRFEFLVMICFGREWDVVGCVDKLQEKRALQKKKKRMKMEEKDKK